MSRCAAWVAMALVLLWPVGALSQEDRAVRPGQEATYLTFEAPWVETNGVMMVPMRTVLNWLGVSPDVEGGKLTVRAGDTTLVLQAGKKEYTLDGKACAFPAAVYERASDTTTLVPLRSFCEALGVRVTWSEQERMILLQSGGKVAKIATATAPLGQGDILWVSSSPLGAGVYAEKPGEEQPSCLGVTPLAVRLAPGRHRIIVVVPITNWPDLAKPISLQAKEDEAALNELAKKGRKIGLSFTADGAEEARQMQVNMTMRGWVDKRGNYRQSREGTVDWGYVWTVTKTANQQANLVAVFHRKNR